jgi:hypothetical protein
LIAGRSLYAFLEGSLLEEFSLTTPKTVDRADHRSLRAIASPVVIGGVLVLIGTLLIGTLLIRFSA